MRIWRRRGEIVAVPMNEVCGGGVRNAGDRVSTLPNEVVDASGHDLPEVFAMSDDGQTASGGFSCSADGA